MVKQCPSTGCCEDNVILKIHWYVTGVKQETYWSDPYNMLDDVEYRLFPFGRPTVTDRYICKGGDKLEDCTEEEVEKAKYDPKYRRGTLHMYHWDKKDVVVTLFGASKSDNAKAFKENCLKSHLLAAACCLAEWWTLVIKHKRTLLLKANLLQRAVQATLKEEKTVNEAASQNRKPVPKAVSPVLVSCIVQCAERRRLVKV